MTEHHDRAWWADAVIYQIYVRSFADSDGDGIGDLEGIRRNLDHLVDLGVDGLWLTPCYPSPQRDHGYDVADYFDIEPAYGTLDGIDALIADAHDRGLKLMMDIVPNHCSDQHEWFREALASEPGSAARARFYFADGRGADHDEPPNNWMADFGGSSWTPTGDGDGQWYLGTFTPHQPDWNHNHPDVIEMFDRVLRFWSERGVDGFRVDAVAPIAKAPGLPDAPPPPPGATPAEVRLSNPYLSFRAEGHDVWRRWRRTLDAFGADHPGNEPMMIAEAWTPGRPDLLAEFLRPDEYHQAFDFDLIWSSWHAPSMRTAIAGALELGRTSAGAPAWTLNNHDVQRIVTRFGYGDADTEEAATRGVLFRPGTTFDPELGQRRARAAVALMLALPGSVYLYAGEELGLPEVLDLPDAVRQDPVFHNTGGKLIGRDGCRIPLPWTSDTATAFGFSPPGASPPWLPQPDDWGDRSAERQRDDKTSMLSLYRTAIAARARWATPAGPDAEVVALDIPRGERVVAVRRGELLVVCNTGREPVDVPAAGDVVLCAGADEHANPGVTSDLRVPGDTTMWVVATPRS